jgi:hypothetical protein
MKHLKLLGVALAALFALGISATTAFALPDVSLTLTGSSFPLHLDVTLLSVATKLTSASGAGFEGVGFLLLLLALSLTSLGTFEALFTKVKETGGAGSECKSPGDPLGEVLTKGTYHIVYTALTPLTLGLLFLVQPVTLTCGASEFDVRGLVLSSINPGSIGTEGTELISVLGASKGNGKGKPNVTTYYNDGGTAVKAKLETEFGAGFVETDEEVEAEITLLALKTNMFVITSR